MRFRWLAAAVMCAVGCARLVAAGEPTVAEAVRARDHQKVAALLKARADVNASFPDGTTALHWAAHWDDLETTDALIRAGARVNAADELGATPLWVAANQGSAGVVERLLKAGANPNSTLEEGETPLIAAARAGSVEAVNALLVRGANPNANDRGRSQTALMWAAAYRHPGVVATLLEHGAAVNARSSVRQRLVKLKGTETRSMAGVEDEALGGFTPLLFSVRMGDVESARLLLAAGASVNDASPNGVSALVLSTHSGHSAMTAFLLSQGADANDSRAGYTALHAAVLRGDVASVGQLLSHGADPNARLRRATRVRNKSMDWAMSAFWVGATPFWMAAKFAEIEIMRTLVAARADTRMPSANGTPPVMAAMGGIVDRWGNDPADNGYINLLPIPPEEDRMILATLRLLVEELGADVNQTNDAGEAAIHRAAYRRIDPAVEFLAKHGADLDAANKRGQTPITLTRTGRYGADADGEDGRNGAATEALLRKLGATMAAGEPDRERARFD